VERWSGGAVERWSGGRVDGWTSGRVDEWRSRVSGVSGVSGVSRGGGKEKEKRGNQLCDHSKARGYNKL
jgi:hypothetical protein